MNDELDFEVIRPRDTKKKGDLAYCKWAAGDEEAKFYVGTPTHDKQIADHLHQLIYNVAWFDWKPKKVDRLAAARSHRAKSGRSRGRRNSDDE